MKNRYARLGVFSIVQTSGKPIQMVPKRRGRSDHRPVLLLLTMLVDPSEAAFDGGAAVISVSYILLKELVISKETATKNTVLCEKPAII